MSLQYTSRSSLVERVIEQMRSQINAGEWTPGMRIPTESQLSNSLAGHAEMKGKFTHFARNVLMPREFTK